MPKHVTWIRREAATSELGVPLYKFVPVDIFSRREVERLRLTPDLKETLRRFREWKTRQTPTLRAGVTLPI